MKTGDTIPKLRLKLIQDGDSFNLDDYSVAITIRRSDKDTNLVDTENNLTTVKPESPGIVEYEWQDGDTDEQGTYLFEVVATHDTNGNEITFPKKSYKNIFIKERL